MPRPAGRVKPNGRQPAGWTGSGLFADVVVDLDVVVVSVVVVVVVVAMENLSRWLAKSAGQ